MKATRRVLLLVLLIASAASAADHDYWADLMSGNARYVAGNLIFSHLEKHRRDTREGQYPPVTIISCADSRVPPELIFDQTIGDIFVVRVAGNVIDDYNLASVEYAVSKGWTKLIVVMGHESCGAVEAALSGKDPGSDPLRALVKKIRTNINYDVRKPPPPPLRQATDRNARASAEQLGKSDIIKNKKVPIVTAYYSFDGKVTKLGD
jgi:carbonic anhydrase